MSRRQQRVADLVRLHVSQILLRDVQDPRIRLASITDVSMSPDLKNARILVSVLGDDDDRQEAARALREASGFVRHQLASQLRDLRSIPKLSFELDRGAEHSQHISDLLERLHEHSNGS